MAAVTIVNTERRHRHPMHTVSQAVINIFDKHFCNHQPHFFAMHTERHVSLSISQITSPLLQ